MSNDVAGPLVIDLAKAFIALVMSIEPMWRKAYLRFETRDSEREIKASLMSESGVQIIDVLEHKDFFHPATTIGQELIQALGKEVGVFLLIVDSSFDYEVKFEYEDMDRWKISKFDGGTGIPAGLE
jgi:hypothetical protein